MPMVRAVALTGSDQAVSAGQCLFRGFVLRNSHATNVSTVQVYDNAAAASGTLLASITLAAAGGNSNLGPFQDGIRADNGVFIHVTGTGTLEGSVLIG